MTWSQKVRKQSGEKCRVCGSKENLTAHHLYSQSAYPELQDNPANGMCLCHSCHVSFHQDCGSTTTPKMFQAWAKKHPNITQAQYQTIVNICNQRGLRKFTPTPNSKLAKASTPTFTHFMTQAPEVTVKLTPRLHRFLKEKCKDFNLSESEYITYLLEYELECAST